MADNICTCGHTRASHHPGECVGCTGPNCTWAGPRVDGEVLSLPDLLEALSDAAGLLDQVVENLAHHRHAEPDSGRMVELHAIEDFTSQGWAYTRQAHTTLTGYLAVKDA